MANICVAFDADGCVIIRTAAGVTAYRSNSVYTRTGKDSGERIRAFIRTGIPNESLPILTHTQGCNWPAAIAKHDDTAILIYREHAKAFFVQRDADLLGALWRNCGPIGLQARENTWTSALPEDAQLSPRLQQVLDLLLDGLSEKQIAKEIQLSQHTVHVYVKGVYRRLGVNSRTQLATRCLQRNAASRSTGSIAGQRVTATFEGQCKKIICRQIEPCDQIISAPHPVTTIIGSNQHMELRLSQPKGQDPQPSLKPEPAMGENHDV